MEIRELVTSESKLRIRNPNDSSIVIFELEGKLSSEIAQEMVNTGEQILEKYGTLSVLNDWENATDYDKHAQLILTKTLFEIRDKAKAFHLFANDKEMKFAVEVANIVLKNKVIVHEARSSFEYAKRWILDKIPL